MKGNDHPVGASTEANQEDCEWKALSPEGEPGAVILYEILCLNWKLANLLFMGWCRDKS